MTDLDRKFIEIKLDLLNKYYNIIKQLCKFDIAKIKKDIYKLSTAERHLQLLVDTMIDVNMHIIKRLTLRPSPDLEGTFKVLGQNGVLNQAFAEKIAPVVGVRNRLVHRYEEIDTELFLRNLKKHHGDFLTYARAIKRYIDKKAE